MWKMILIIGAIVLIIIVIAFFTILCVALRNHFSWGDKEKKNYHLHWQERYYSTKKEGL
jgi:uncharacterized membrane protein